MTAREAALLFLQLVVAATVAAFVLWLLVFAATWLFDPGFFELTPEQQNQ